MIAMRQRVTSSPVARGVLGGLGAGAFLCGLAMWHATVGGRTFYDPLHTIASQVGSGVLSVDGAIGIALGSGVLAGLMAAMGAAFGAIAPLLRTNGTAALLGGASGLLIYLGAFVVLDSFFPAAESADKPFWFSALVVSGFLLGIGLYSSDGRRTERPIQLGAMRREELREEPELRQVGPTEPARREERTDTRSG